MSECESAYVSNEKCFYFLLPQAANSEAEITQPEAVMVM